MDYRDLFYRFLFGGIAVVLSYVTSIVLPWEMIGGIFAAFPAVMIVAVMMVGIKKGSKEAAKTAQGSVFGMIGCLVCVVTVLLTLQATKIWWLSITAGLIAWFISSMTLVEIKGRFFNRIKVM